MADDDAELLAPLLRPAAARALHDEGDGVLSVLPEDGDASAGRFEGVYGPVYDRVIQTDAIRRFASLAYGDAGPVPDLDGFARRVAEGTPGDFLLDVPCGGGTLLPRLRAQGYTGVLVQSDLGLAMLRRAAKVRDRLADGETLLLRADAQDLPFADATLDAAVSLNGLHCIPDPRTFVDELARVVRPGGRLFLVTLVTGGTLRADLAIRAGRVSGVIPTSPPPRGTLLRWLKAAGWVDVESLGGEGLIGVSAVRAR